jgi:hypothetical protein
VGKTKQWMARGDPRSMLSATFRACEMSALSPRRPAGITTYTSSPVSMTASESGPRVRRRSNGFDADATTSGAVFKCFRSFHSCVSLVSVQVCHCGTYCRVRIGCFLPKHLPKQASARCALLFCFARSTTKCGSQIIGCAALGPVGERAVPDGNRAGQAKNVREARTHVRGALRPRLHTAGFSMSTDQRHFRRQSYAVPDL